jgi:hypothetical protein
MGLLVAALCCADLINREPGRGEQASGRHTSARTPALGDLADQAAAQVTQEGHLPRPLDDHDLHDGMLLPVEVDLST